MMKTQLKLSVLALSALASLSFSAGAVAAQTIPDKKMSFFVTSVGSGKGGDLGGLAGADKHCQDLATAVGAGKRTWHAYLSTSASVGTREVNARYRIGQGPWYNAKGARVARNLDELHQTNYINKQSALTEKGEVVNGRGDTPNMHDMLTGSDSHGLAFKGNLDTTCGNWTKSGEGSAQVGHHDRKGLDDKLPAQSWNHSHPSRGCSVEALRSTGGNGLFYCFATN